MTEIALEIAQYHNLTRFAGTISESTLDDLPDGSTYVRVKTAYIDAGKITLTLAEGDLDDIDNGTNFGKVAITDISAGHILLATCSGDADDIEDAATTNRFTTANGALGALRAYVGIDSDGIVIAKVKPSANAAPGAISGLYLGADYLGYFDGAAWKTYMDSSGNFYLGGATGTFQWDGTDLTIQSSTANQRIVIASSDNTLKFYDATGLVITIDDNLGTYTKPGILIDNGVLVIDVDTEASSDYIPIEIGFANGYDISSAVTGVVAIDIDFANTTTVGGQDPALLMGVHIKMAQTTYCTTEIYGSYVDLTSESKRQITGVWVKVENTRDEVTALTTGLRIFSVVSDGGAAYGIYISTITSVGGNAYAIYNSSAGIIYSGAEIKLDADLEFVGSQAIKSTSNGNISITPNGSGDISLDPDTGTILCTMDVELTAGKKVTFDGTGGGEYFIGSGNEIHVYVGGVKQGEWTATGLVLTSIDGMASVGNISITQDSAVHAILTLTAGEGKNAILRFAADEGDDAGDKWQIISTYSQELSFGSDVAVKDTFEYKMILTTDGDLTLTGSIAISTGQVVYLDGNGGNSYISDVGGLMTVFYVNGSLPFAIAASEVTVDNAQLTVNGDIVVATTKGVTLTGTATGSLGAPTNGTIKHDSTTNKIVARLNGAWETITSV